jgi:hypothetical protein
MRSPGLEIPFIDSDPPGGFPWPEAKVLVELRDSTTGGWVTRGDLIPVTAEIHAASLGRCRAELTRTYGRMFEAGDPPTLADKTAEYLADRWVRFRLQLPLIALPVYNQTAGDTPTEPVLIWQGIIDAPQQAPDNVAAGALGRGEQRLLASGGDLWLERIKLLYSYWRLPKGSPPPNPPEEWEVKPLGWLPDFNGDADSGHARGNRSPVRTEGAYDFGGTDVWTHHDMIEHLVCRYIQQFDPTTGEPVWPIFRVSDPLQVLDAIVHPVPLSRCENAYDALCKIVDPHWGADWFPIPTEEGFTIVVFPITNKEIVTPGGTWPVNTSTESLNLAGATDVEVEIEEDRTRLTDGVVVRGRRIVSCLSFGYAGQNLGQALWSQAQEEAYKAGAGPGQEPDAHKRMRADERFRDVFQTIGLKLGNWQGGLAAPKCDGNGELVYEDVPRQTQIRGTLNWLPLREGYDYSVNPPVWNGEAGTVPELRPPLAVIIVPETSSQVPVDKLSEQEHASCEVRALEHEWGLRLRSPPNHQLAHNHWAGAQPDDYDPETQGLDYAWITGTIALELDHPVEVWHEWPPEQKAGYGLWEIVEVPEAELWLLAPLTVVGVHSNGGVLASPNEVIVLRDDRPLLRTVLAGAVARSMLPRMKATIIYSALHPVVGALGKILELLNIDGTNREINAPYTTVKWWFTERKTQVSAGLRGR